MVDDPCQLVFFLGVSAIIVKVEDVQLIGANHASLCRVQQSPTIPDVAKCIDQLNFNFQYLPDIHSINDRFIFSATCLLIVVAFENFEGQKRYYESSIW